MLKKAARMGSGILSVQSTKEKSVIGHLDPFLVGKIFSPVSLFQCLRLFLIPRGGSLIVDLFSNLRFCPTLSPSGSIDEPNLAMAQVLELRSWSSSDSVLLRAVSAKSSLSCWSWHP